MSEGVPLPIVSAGRLPRAEPVFGRIAVVGLGFMGGSLALAARQVWPDGLVIGIDHNDVVETAVRMRAIDVGGDDLVLAGDADLIVLAAPVMANAGLLEAVAQHVTRPCVVTDLGGAMRTMVEASAVLPPTMTFVPGHPMAGGPFRGIDAARPDLFVGRPWVLASAQPEAADVDRLRRFVEGVGAEARFMTAADHDRLSAYLNQLPQLVVSTLMQVLGENLREPGLQFAGRGLSDTTRLASMPGGVWKDVVAANADLAGRALDDFMEMMTYVRSNLESSETIEGLFESAAFWKGRLPTRRPSDAS